jgi:Na+-transporting NADH:ubiquinone oxidoreductase subunit NqrB
MFTFTYFSSPLRSAVRWFQSDARFFQILAQSIFLLFGILALGWSFDPVKISVTMLGAFSAQVILIYWKKIPLTSLRSAMVTVMGLTLLLRSDHAYIFFIAAFLAIIQKGVIVWNKNHFFNPANFGIGIVVLTSSHAWISPGQWGSNALLVFLFITISMAVLGRVKRWDTALAFISVFALSDIVRQCLILGWGLEVPLYRLSNGALWLFTLLMITDPMTTPRNNKVRILWAGAVGFAAFWLNNYYFIYAAPFWILLLATPFVPLLNNVFPAEKFQWNQNLPSRVIPNDRSVDSSWRKILASVIILLSTTGAWSFCGFYVSKADASLFNNRSEVIFVRDGNRNIITMTSDFRGNVEDFAMVVPVPVVLKRDEIKVVNRGVFEALDSYSSPRLVEYYDENPCERKYYMSESLSDGNYSLRAASMEKNKDEEERYQVRIEARYEVGEYDILLLSASESQGLKYWLTDHGYKIPDQAEEVLDPYIRNNMKFFVCKVNADRMPQHGDGYLSPLQISFDHPRFMLPIRLGMANSNGTQDMIVYAFSKKGRIECANYRTVEIPTDRNIPLFVQRDFGNFYSNLFDKAWNREGKSCVFLEYAWNVSLNWNVKCDPCVGPPPAPQEFADAGVNWASSGGSVFFTRLHVRYGRAHFPVDLTFQETSNQENFQARYIITHAAQGSFECEEGQEYLNGLSDRRKKEVDEAYALSGLQYPQSFRYIHEFDRTPVKNKKGEIVPFIPGTGRHHWPGLLFISSLFALAVWMGRKTVISQNFSR